MNISGIGALRSAKDTLGSEAELARVVGVKQPSVNYTLNKADRVPAEWCIPVDLATSAKGRRISCHQLRPDLWPEEFRPQQQGAAA